jgi:hypothetical protein
MRGDCTGDEGAEMIDASIASMKQHSRPGERTTARPDRVPVDHENYHGEYVFDPDRNNVEAVCHKPG